MLKQSPEDYFRKSITVPFLYCTLNEMKTRFTDLHARTALGLQLVPSIIENIAPYLSIPVNRVSGSAPEVNIIPISLTLRECLSMSNYCNIALINNYTDCTFIVVSYRQTKY